jgi:hypothetical protein
MRLVSPSKVRESVRTMIDHGIRLPRKAVDGLLIRIGESPL